MPEETIIPPQPGQPMILIWVENPNTPQAKPRMHSPFDPGTTLVLMETVKAKLLQKLFPDSPIIIPK